MKEYRIMLIVVFLLALGLLIVASIGDSLLTQWKQAAANTLRCGGKGAEIVERPAAEGLATTAMFIICK